MQSIYQCCVSFAFCCIAGCLAVNSEITAHSVSNKEAVLRGMGADM